MTKCIEIEKLREKSEFENIKYELKSSKILKEKDWKDKIAKEIISFANRNGGKIIIGLQNDGSFDGKKDYDVDILKGDIDNIIHNKMSPVVRYNFEFLECEEGDLSIIIIEQKKDIPSAYIVKREGVLLEATENEFENQAVLNPTVVQQGDTLHLFYRAVKEGNYSSIGYCRLEGSLNIVERKKSPILFPEYDYEKHGIEDPRVVFLDGIYYLFYTAYDGKNALIAYATSKDLKIWEKHGLISPKITYDEVKNFFHSSNLKEKYFFFVSYYKDVVDPDVLLWEKDSFIFPKKFNNKFALIHRILPDIQIIYFEDFNQLTTDFWKKYLKKLGDYVILEPKYGYESRNIGAGAPLIETQKGWLMIYHSVEDSN